MNKGNLNKLVTNYPVELTEEEIANLSGTLAPVIAACGGGGGGTGGKIYTGIGFVTVNNTTNQIGLTNEANTKLNQDIPTKVSDLSDSANYQTVAGMDQYLTEGEAQATYLTKSSADTLYAPLSTTADIDVLKANSGDFSQYYTKNETYSKNEVYTKEDVYQKTETSSISELANAFLGIVTNSELEIAIGDVNQRIYDLADTVGGKQDILTFGKDGTGAISSIDGTPLAGQGGTTYSAGQYINIDSNDTISVTGVMALDEYAQYEPVLIGDANITATPSKVDNHTQWNLAINATPVVTNTKLTGQNCVTAHTTQVSGEWAVGLVQSAYEAIDSIDGISTDVGTLKTASSNWNKVSDKLDTTAFSTVSGTFLTTIPDTYATKEYANNASSNALNEAETWVENKHYLTEVPDTYALKTDIPTTVAQLTDSDNYYTKSQTSGATELSTEFGKYALKSEIPTVPTKVSDLTDSANYYKTTETSGANELSTEFAKYLTNTQYNTDSATFALKTDLNDLVSSASITTEADYVMTTAGWKVLTLPGGGMTQVIHDDTLTGQGNADDNKLGLAQTAYNAITSVSSKLDTTSFSTVSGTFLTKSSADNDYAPISITATVNTLTAASARWDEVSAKLGTAQYATDSATFVTKPDTTQTVLNNNYLIYSTLTDPTATTGWMPLSANYYSKTEADGRYAKASAALTSVSANTPLSGNGTTANPLGFDLTNAYTIDGTNGITAVPNSTTNKVVVQMTNDVWTDTQVVHSSISAWNEVSGLSAKSTVSANTATNVISVSANSTATTANISATTYYTNTADSNLVAQRLFVVHNDADLVAHVQAGLCHGQGSLFFVMSGFNS